MGPFGAGKVPGRKHTINLQQLEYDSYPSTFFSAMFDALPKGCSENMKNCLKYVGLKHVLRWYSQYCQCFSMCLNGRMCASTRFEIMRPQSNF